MHPRIRGAVARAVVVLPAIAVLATPGWASASPRVGVPRVHVSGVTGSSFTVTVRAAHATHYRLYADTNRAHVYVRNISKAQRASSHRSSVTIRGLHYTTKPYNYRVEAMSATRHSWSDIFTVGLRPAAPTNLRAVSSSAGTSLTWSSHGATGIQISQATDPGMTQNLRTYTTRTDSHQFTPYGLVRGGIYYFRVRALNATTPSAYSAVAQTTVVTAEQPVRVLTYNVKESRLDGTREGGRKVAPWSQRVVGVVHLIRQADPDVVGLQEAAGWVGKVRGKRQADDIADRLGYTLARTEIPPSEKHYRRHGVYILFNPSTYRAVGDGNDWALGQSRWAAYQILANRTTGASFLFVTPHLAVGNRVKRDHEREAETESLIRQASAYAGAHHVPVVYAGDFNSHSFRKPDIDGPGIAMSAHHIADAFTAAQTMKHARYNSGNGYFRKPPKTGDSLDHVYADPGVGIRSWRLILDLKHGHFVGVIPSDHNPLVSDLTLPY